MPSATTPNALAHIPAWKRLGLQLKSAQQTPETVSEAESTKRKRAQVEDDFTPSWKFKNTSANSSNKTPITPSLARKKSVTFTQDTKPRDGDSIKQLFNSWVAEQKSQDPSFELKTSGPAFQTPEPSQVEEDIDTTLDEKERKVKRVKTPKNNKTTTKASKISQSPKAPTIPTRPFLQYLKQYCESKDTWKFNKNHQNHIIRSVFNLEAIPSEYAHFIYPYVRGLQGGVRTRLRDTALAVKVKDQEEGPAGFPATMPQQERRQLEYDSAMKNYVAAMIAANSPPQMGYEEGVMLGLGDGLMKERAAKRMRSEHILHDLAWTPDVSEGADKAMDNGNKNDEKKSLANDGAAQKVARKRKQRTFVEEESSSSSEDSSSSDSESDDSSENSKRGNSKPDDSSSSSSSSSSGSDADEEDSEEESSEDSEDSDSD